MGDIANTNTKLKKDTGMIILENNKIYYGAILGHLSKLYGSSIDLPIANLYFLDAGLPSLNKDEIETIISDIRSEDYNEVKETYAKVKSSSWTLKEVFKSGKYNEPLQYHYFDGTEIKAIPTDELDQLVYIKHELQSNSPTGKLSKKKFLKKVEALHLKNIYPSDGFYDLLDLRENLITLEPSLTNYNGKAHDMISESVELELGIVNTQKREAQNTYRQLNKVKRSIQDRLIFRNELLNAISNNVKIETTFKDTNSDLSETSLVVYMSDWHIGASVDWSDNHYNLEIAKKLVKHYFNEVNNYIKRYKPKSIYLVNLGDMIEGTYMRANQTYTIEFPMGQQQIEAIKLVSDFVTSIRNLGYPTYYTGIGGNHDRYASNKKENIYGDSFAIVLNGVIENLSKGIEGLEYIEPDTIYRTGLTVNGANIENVHGDLDDLSNKDILATLSQFNHTVYDTVVGGHKHSSLIRETQNGWVVQTGSLIGGNEYNDSFREGASRSQQILIVDKNGNVTPNIVKIQ